MKKILNLILMILGLNLILGVISCKKELVPEITYCTLELNPMGGNFDQGVKSSFLYESGKKIQKIYNRFNPKKEGYNFAGWCEDSECTTLIKFPYEILSDVTFFARYQKIEDGPGEIVPPGEIDPPAVKKFTVTFMDQGQQFDCVEVELGKNCDAPLNAPVKDGYVFAGWFTDLNGVNKFDFETPVYENKILYSFYTKSVVKVQSVKIEGYQQFVHDQNKVFDNETGLALSAIVLPADATNSDVEWKSSAENVISVDSKGNLLIKSTGTALITATAKDNGGASDSIELQVEQHPIAPQNNLEKILLEEKIDSTSEERKFSVTAVYTDGSTKDVTSASSWVCTEPNVAAINCGNVDFISEGVTGICATYTENGKSLTAKKYLEVEKYSEKIYMIPDSNVIIEGAWFAACFYTGDNNEDSGKWVKLNGTNDLLECEIPSGNFEKIRIYRMKNTATENQMSSANAWNYNHGESTSGIPETKNTFTVTGWGSQPYFEGNWSYVQHNSTGVTFLSTIILDSDTSLKDIQVDGISCGTKLYASTTKDYVTVTAFAKHPEASVTVTGGGKITSGESVNFVITVTAFDGTKENYNFSVKGGLDLSKAYKRCVIEDTVNKTIIFVYDNATWGTSVNGSTSVSVSGKFGWNYALKYDSEKDGFYSDPIPIKNIKKPGNSGQPQYIWNGVAPNVEDWLRWQDKPKNIDSGDTQEYYLVVFERDDVEYLKFARNLEKSVMDINSFDESNLDDCHHISNFRQVNSALNLYRSYHPYNPSKSMYNTERMRLEQIWKFATEVGIKSDIDLSSSKFSEIGKSYTCNGKSYQVELPPYYQDLKDKEQYVHANSSYETVYYASNSSDFRSQVKTVVDFINSDKGVAPFQIHCAIGCDRTGIFCGVLEALCGVSWKDIQHDYVQSNYMQIEEGRGYNFIRYSFENMLGVDEIEEVENNLEAAVCDYFIKNDTLTQADINNLKQKLLK